VEEGIVSAELFNRRIRLQLPERLPRAMDPDDLRKLLSVIDDIRDRAMILVLLRTGLRIGELLNTKMADVHIKERRIEIYEGEKNRLGRVVYLSDDATMALRKWLRKRNPGEEYLIYTRAETMSYSTARTIFLRYLVKAGLTDKGYSCIPFAIPLPRSFSTPACVWSVSRFCWVTEASRRPGVMPS
jgi:integrase/recombinase XerD